MKRNKTQEVPVASSPYLDARRQWMEEYGGFIAREKAWRTIAIVSLVLATVSIAVVAYTATRSQFVPYIVEKDKLGATVAVGRAERTGPTDPRVIQAQLAEWLNNTRSVSVDAGLQRRGIDKAYALIARSGQAKQQLDAWMMANEPFKRAASELVTVEIHTVLPVGDNSWRIEWTETTRDREGKLLSTTPWQATVTVAVSPPKTETGIFMNPTGLLIQSFAWSQRL